MESTQNGEKKGEIQEVFEKNGARNSMKLRDYIPVHIENDLIDQSRRKRRFLDFLKARPSKDWFLKFGFVGRLSAFSFVKRNVSQKNGSQPADPPLDGGRRRYFRVPFVRKINREALIKYCKNWIKHPMNMALLVWLFFVAAGLVMIFLLMTGLLNSTITNSADRDRWTEILNQIVNALFTIMCLYQHPRIFHHLALLWRWEPSDIAEARGIYCKKGTHPPHERAHIMFVVILLHITCFSQYVLCALYWAYSSKNRPDWATYLCIGVGIVAPVVAALYLFFSPLGRKYKSQTDEESQRQLVTDTKPDRVDLKLSASTRVVVTSPEWIGGLFDCWDDMTVAYLSFFCTFCVFGWNMERLGFGNMYVHIFTFILLCIAPFLVFSVSALNIKDDTVQYIVGITGIVLCFFGFLYGGFWRMQMRRKFKLPGNPFCCGYAVVTDFMQWLLCWSCSLAQEVRTGNFYDVEEESLYRKESSEGSRSVMIPLRREGPSSSIEKARDGSGDALSITIDEELPVSTGDQMMTPPLQPLIELEDNQQAKG